MASTESPLSTGADTISVGIFGATNPTSISRMGELAALLHSELAQQFSG